MLNLNLYFFHYYFLCFNIFYIIFNLFYPCYIYFNFLDAINIILFLIFIGLLLILCSST